ncbi:hypothetical protein [Luteimonas suaedae]|uniref:hypothetical protein n=1 Tax=Luteimonas suaedae TaxID=2605430 RepID=UPI0011EF6C80|nr:hypothetical protein [Luteimonas suaedae]
MCDAIQGQGHSRTAAPPAAGRGVKLLWTGGWDSTFQLLRLLLKHHLPVVPYYLEDPTRASTATELRTMQRIGDALHDAFPETRELLRPLRTFPIVDLEPDPAIANALRTIRSRIFIGSQYEWLPLFCKRHGMTGIELSVHVDDKVQALLSSFVCEFDRAGSYRSFRVDPRHAGTAEHTLFRCFDFPLFRIDKRAMAREAENEGWSRIMHMTWFCHRPLRGRPCGVCAPCVYAIEEGMAWRVPRARRVLSFFYRTLVLPLKPPIRAALASVWKR